MSEQVPEGATATFFPTNFGKKRGICEVWLGGGDELEFDSIASSAQPACPLARIASY
jgi:hypothetical protein